jgi:predicted HD phosphohydrolase
MAGDGTALRPTLRGMRTVNWTKMQDGDQADYEMLSPAFEEHARSNLVDNLCNMLGLLKGDKLGYQTDRYSHSLQSGTRALRNGESIDMIIGALLHDVADGFAPENHSDAAAAVLAPYVDDETHWVIKHHGIFQGYYYFHHLGGDRDARERYQDVPFYDRCVDFCQNYDQNCFDPNYPVMQLEEFRPMLDEVFSRPSRVPGVALIES